ncbi:MAG: sortase [Acidimicrobiales bacterium]|nr:sortase [Acidimicrobiales bacterium]
MSNRRRADGQAMTVDDARKTDETSAPVIPLPRLAIVLGSVGRALILGGFITFLFVGFQLWGTDIHEARAQDELRTDMDERFDAAVVVLDELLADPTPKDADEPNETIGDDASAVDDTSDADETDVPLLPTTSSTLPGGHDPDVLALLFPDEGDAIARLEIPSIEVDKIAVRGVLVADLRKGPGHYSQTALPGNSGNASIAGHRTTYGAPFNRIDELVRGDEITVTSVQGEFIYRVMDPLVAYADHLEQIDGIGEGHIIVHPNAGWVLENFGDDRLTLTACHPKLSSRQRIIVAAELVTEVVALPEWVIQAQAERESETITIANEPQPSTNNIDDAAADQSGTEAAFDTDVTKEPRTRPADLDEGLNGEQDAIPGAVMWMLAGLVFWYGGGRIGRRMTNGLVGRLAFRFAGLVPAIFCLWFSFEMIDRALPAG